MVKLNENSQQRKVGLFFMVLWFVVLIFYLTWDGLVWEWLYCGYEGPNQHFDFDLFDMTYEYTDEGVTLIKTNNIFNIIYLCYFTLFMGWAGLLFDNKYLKQGCMATLGFPVIAAMSTIVPLENHLYFIQIVYDTVHVSGTIVGVYLFYTEDLKVKETLPSMAGIWIIYIASRIIFTRWPYWEYDRLAYYPVNQINDMPFYFYGLEFLLVIFIFLTVNTLFQKLGDKFPNKHFKGLFPFVIFSIICIVFLVTGIIQVPLIIMDNCGPIL